MIRVAVCVDDIADWLVGPNADGGKKLASFAQAAAGVDHRDCVIAHDEADTPPGEESSARALQSTVGLVWRALLLWMLLLLLLSIAVWFG